MRVVRRQPLSSSDYAALDKPTVQRQRAAVTAGAPQLLPLFDALCDSTRALATTEETAT